MFPGPRAVTVQNMIQSLTERLEDPTTEPRRKRFKGSSSTDCPTHREGQRGVVDCSDGGVGVESKALPLQKVVFIDSTWNQTNKISMDERLQGTYQLCNYVDLQKERGKKVEHYITTIPCYDICRFIGMSQSRTIPVFIIGGRMLKCKQLRGPETVLM